MGKGKGNRQTYMYNRQTKAYALNAQKDMLRKAGIKEPKKRVDGKTLKKTIKIFGIAGAVLIAGGALIGKWTGLFICLGIVILAALGYIIYLRSIDMEWLKYYKAMGVTKKEFINMAVPKGDPKLVKRYSKRWDKVKVEPVVPAGAKKIVR